MTTPRSLLKALEVRDGRECLWHGTDTGRLVPQHRVGGMGGSKTKHRLVNVVWLDLITNGLIESDPHMQRLAMARGVKVSKFADPARVPVFYAHQHAWFVLEDDTRRQIGGPEALDMMHDVYGDKYLGWTEGWR